MNWTVGNDYCVAAGGLLSYFPTGMTAFNKFLSIWYATNVPIPSSHPIESKELSLAVGDRKSSTTLGWTTRVSVFTTFQTKETGATHLAVS